MMEHCNLLPLEFQRRLLIRSRLLQWSVVWGVITVAVAGLAVHRVCFMFAQQERVQVMERQSEPLRNTVAENERLRGQLEEMTGREVLLGELDSAAYPLQLMGLVSRGASACEERLQVREFSLQRVQNAPRQTTTTSAPAEVEQSQPVAEMMRLTLEGRAVDDLAIARFVTALRQTRVFESVELKSSVGSQFGNTWTREYQVACTF